MQRSFGLLRRYPRIHANPGPKPFTRPWALDKFRAVKAALTLRNAGWTALHTFNFFCFGHICSHYGIFIRATSGPSMLPTLGESGEWVLENLLSVRLNPEGLQRGDIITYVSPLNMGRLVCKRVLGLPGDIICVDPSGEYAPSTEHVVVPKGHLWVAGDNAAWSRDSRAHGPIPLSLVHGRVLARVWPWKDRTWFRNPMTSLE